MSGIRPLGLGEVALRVTDLERAIGFYRDGLGFELLRRVGNGIAFMRIAAGVAGHTQVIGLFDARLPADPRRPPWGSADPAATTLHHFAIEIDRNDYDAALACLRERDLAPDTAVHGWIGWRSIYVSDPDGNTVEFVCYDREALAP
jgi:catechol 2,3-dioxygenase